ncbi:hypothetical protein LZ31DRAFT_272442 [Colletotrichum somersetense]|nr:hypothetical protein LZ31DRAFT_272442 [Colletotrichum somersetense]
MISSVLFSVFSCSPVAPSRIPRSAAPIYTSDPTNGQTGYFGFPQCQQSRNREAPSAYRQGSALLYIAPSSRPNRRHNWSQLGNSSLSPRYFATMLFTVNSTILLSFLGSAALAANVNRDNSPARDQCTTQYGGSSVGSVLTSKSTVRSTSTQRTTVTPTITRTAQGRLTVTVTSTVTATSTVTTSIPGAVDRSARLNQESVLGYWHCCLSGTAFAKKVSLLRIRPKSALEFRTLLEALG